MQTMKLLFFCVFFTFAGGTWAEEPQSGAGSPFEGSAEYGAFEDEGTADSAPPGGSGVPSWFTSSAQTRQKWAIVPSYVRNSTYGHIVGGRFFIYPTGNTGYYTALESAVSEDLFFSTAFSYKYWRENGDQFDLTTYYEGFSEPYYGEGNYTRPEDRIDIPIHKVQARMEYVSRIQSALYGGLFLRFDYRRERRAGETNQETPFPRFPLEQVVSGGLLVRYDSRNNYFNPTEGEYYQVQSFLLSDMPSPVFLEGDIRLFFSLMEGLVLALRGSVGLTFLNPASHLFRFSLGGADRLRGYLLNRFRGENHYLSQAELRYTPFRFVTVTGFFDLGAVYERDFPAPRYSYGGGLRFGLPPDYNKKIRVEFGRGEDQHNIVVSFGHPF